jgi:TonB dependent receptor/TonB-dependent Receptor Plug Domain
MRLILLLAVFFFSTIDLYSQGTVRINGYISEEGSEEPLIGAIISDTVSRQYAVSNEFGYFIFLGKNLNNQRLRISYAGYQPNYLDWKTLNTLDSTYTVYLSPYRFKEAVVRVKKIDLIEPGKLSINQLSLSRQPAFGGLPDLFRALGTLSGVSNGGEVFSGLYVRGGEDNQNLYLLDGAPVYGGSHLFNLISLYNTEAIKLATLYKGIAPARYGGRLSSVLDVQLREGTKEAIKGNFNVGVLTSSFLLEGPILKKKNQSFLLAGRTTFYNLLQRKRKKALEENFKGSKDYNGYNFFDLNARYNWEINPSNKLYFNAYYGYDKQTAENQNRYTFTYPNPNFLERDKTKQLLVNSSYCLRYSSVLNDHVFGQVTLSYNKYKNSVYYDSQKYKTGDSLLFVNILEEQYLNENFTNLRKFGAENLSARIESSFFYPKLGKWTVGQELIGHKLNTGIFEYTSGIRDFITKEWFQNTTNASNNKLPFLLEGATYIENSSQFLKSRINVVTGLRANWFDNKFVGFAPSLQSTYRINQKGGLTLGLRKHYQSLFSLSGNANQFDKNIWVPTDAKFPTQNSWIYSIGTNWPNLIPKSEFSVELFHKTMHNLVFFDYQNELSYFNYSEKLKGNGTAKIQGMDFQWNTELKSISASAAYTLSKNTRQFAEVNNGAQYLSTFDSRHDMKLGFSFHPNDKKWNFGANWFYRTGFRFTFPEGFSGVSPISTAFPVYGGINNLKLPDYHRLDLSAKWTYRPKAKTWYKDYDFTFNIINAYDRKNVTAVTFKSETIIDPSGNPKQITVAKGVNILPILPSLNFSIRF